MTIKGKIAKHIIAPIVCAINVLLVRLHLIKPSIIIYMDGGLCSQMGMWLNGVYYAEKGLEVYYDLDWYRRSGKGIDGVSERKFELLTLWPNLTIRTLSRFKTMLYKHFLSWSDESNILPTAASIKRSVYFGGYKGLPTFDFERLFREYYSIDNAARTQQIQLKHDKRYCGVHIRRGDLANVSTSVYPQVADGYFIRAIKYVQKHSNVDVYLFFSDDTEWVKENIFPNVSVPCRVMEGNKGYEDLMLLAQCDVIIASQGSFGMTAALINGHCELYVSNNSRKFEYELAKKMVVVE